MTDLVGVNIFVGPVHFRDMNQTFNPFLELNKCAVIGDVGNLAENPGLLRIPARNVGPGILAELLHPE